MVDLVEVVDEETVAVGVFGWNSVDICRFEKVWGYFVSGNDGTLSWRGLWVPGKGALLIDRLKGLFALETQKV